MRLCPADTALVNGTKALSITLKTAGSATVTASDTDGTKTSYTSPSITVYGGPPSKLMVQTQPSPTATAGAVFAQQPAVYVSDASGNLIATNGVVITAARGAGTGALQGSNSVSTVWLALPPSPIWYYNVAETITLNFWAAVWPAQPRATVSSARLVTGNCNCWCRVRPAAPGTTSGKTGTPHRQDAGASFLATVNAVDVYGTGSMG